MEQPKFRRSHAARRAVRRPDACRAGPRPDLPRAAAQCPAGRGNRADRRGHLHFVGLAGCRIHGARVRGLRRSRRWSWARPTTRFARCGRPGTMPRSRRRWGSASSTRSRSWRARRSASTAPSASRSSISTSTTATARRTSSRTTAACSMPRATNGRSIPAPAAPSETGRRQHRQRHAQGGKRRGCDARGVRDARLSGARGVRARHPADLGRLRRRPSRPPGAAQLGARRTLPGSRGS